MTINLQRWFGNQPRRKKVVGQVQSIAPLHKTCPLIYCVGGYMGLFYRLLIVGSRNRSMRNVDEYENYQFYHFGPRQWLKQCFNWRVCAGTHSHSLFPQCVLWCMGVQCFDMIKRPYKDVCDAAKTAGRRKLMWDQLEDLLSWNHCVKLDCPFEGPTGRPGPSLIECLGWKEICPSLSGVKTQLCLQARSRRWSCVLGSMALCGVLTIRRLLVRAMVKSLDRRCWLCWVLCRVSDAIESVVPSPMWADHVFEGLVLPRSSHDGMFGCLVVAKLYVWCCHAAIMVETGLVLWLLSMFPENKYESFGACKLL